MALEIQEVLRATGHETRLMQAKNWLFEAAMGAGKISAVAIPGFVGVRKKTRPSTRVYLEATALLAICHLRLNDPDKAEPYIAEALRRIDPNITSDKRRAQFRRRVIDVFEAEWVLATLRATQPFEALDPAQVEDEAGRLVATASEDELMELLGRSVPSEVVERIYRVYDFARTQVPPGEQLYLPSPKDRRRQKEVGKTVYEAARIVVWRSLCDPSNDVYKLWFESGVQAVVNKKVVGTAVVAALGGLTIGWLALAAALTAMIFKMGLDVFCEVSKLEGLMIGRGE
ncbi:MAG: hypothetical protein ACYC6F_17635 [Longimicrobiales bacterium]